MSRWPPDPAPLHDADLEAADRLLDQANALLRRHRDAEPAATTVAPQDSDELPILTDVVDESDPELSRLVAQANTAASAQDTALSGQLPADTLTERLIRLDTELSREIETWVSKEFPQILAGELERLTERMQTEMITHLRAVLLPELSQRISRLLDREQDPTDSGRTP